jgi:hypothetical protein
MNKKLYISTPCYDAMLTMQYTMSLLRLVQFCNQHNIDYMIDFLGNESLITRARNKSLNKFMNTDCSHLLFIDSDIEFQPEAVMDLLLFDKDVSCCVYPKKGFNWNKFMYSIQNEQNSKEHPSSRGLDYAYNIMYNDKNELIKNGDFIRVNQSSTGFMMIKREIVEKLNKKHTELEIISDELSNNDTKMYGLFCCMIKDKQYLSEDYSFCQRVNDIGGQVWINVKHNLNHIGKYSFNSDIQNRKNYGRNIMEKQFYR